MTVSHSHAKHIDFRYHFVCEAIQDRIIWVQYISTAEMTADSLTKTLGCEKHEKCIIGMEMSRPLDVSGSLLSFLSPFSFIQSLSLSILILLFSPSLACLEITVIHIGA